MEKVKMVINQMGGLEKLRRMDLAGYRVLRSKPIGPWDNEYVFVKVPGKITCPTCGGNGTVVL